MVFDKSFRDRFHQQRLLRQSPKKKSNEFWVSIHFRWGDVATNNPDKPNFRSGLGFSDYCSCIGLITKMNSEINVFLFAENFPYSELCEYIPSDKIKILNDSVLWKRDIDIMSQSQFLIGGASSFFALGAHLCETCTVIHSSIQKFAKSEYEKTLPTHLNDTFCDGNLECYVDNIKENLV